MNRLRAMLAIPLLAPAGALLAAVMLAAVMLAAVMLVPRSGVAAGNAPPITVFFDHLSTGFELDGVHRDLPCESCHLNAVFKGTPKNCGTCHIAGSVYNATPKTTSHMQTTNSCGACHNTTTFRPAVFVDHNQVLGTCASCHNGTIAQGEGPTHPATSQNCEACHTVVSWNPPKTVDHAQIPMAVSGFCIICHNGTQASGKPANHIATNLECGDCHLTGNWMGANFDHTGIVIGCVNCHNGTRAVGKQASHMPTTNVCEDCHTTGIGTKTPSWAPSKFAHTQMAVTTCATCHSGSVKITTGFVSGQPVTHVPPIPAAIDCGVCHGNRPAAETWAVLAASIPTLHSGLPVSNCLLCHAGQSFAGVPAPYIPMSISGVSPTKQTPLAPPHIPILAGADCSGCHGAAYQAGGFGPATAMSAAKHAFVSTTCDTCHDTGMSFYVGGGTPLQLRPADHVTSADPRMATGDCSLCHETTDWISTALPAGHMPNPANLTCVKCHASAPNDYTPGTLNTISALHTSITGNCGLCHGNNVAALTWFNNFTPKDALLTPAHIPYLSGSDCSSCHAANYVTGGFGGTTMSAAKHAFVPTTCDNCHDAAGGGPYYVGTLTLQLRPADHTTGQQLTGDCSGCHNTTDWTSNVMPPGHMPNPGGQLCSVCHTQTAAVPPNYATITTNLSATGLHAGITGSCSQCHGGPSGALTFYNNNDNPKAAAGLAPPHIPYLNGADCSSCHTPPNYVLGGFGPATAMNAATHVVVPTTCNTCHDTGVSFYTGTGPALQLRPNSGTYDHIHSPPIAQMATGDCSSCHNTSSWIATALPGGHMPNPANQPCTMCHLGASASPPNYVSPFAPLLGLHTGITTGCAQCHGGATQLSFYNNDMVVKAAAALSPPHIPAFTGEDCSSCHKPNYVAGAFYPMNMTQATHAGVGTTCNGCHEANLSYYMGGLSPALQGRPADHTVGQMVSPNDCSLCHNTASWASTALPAGHMPNPASQQCISCHPKAPSDYTPATLAANSALHVGITSGCGQCHGGSAALTWYNNFTPKDAVLTPPHIPYIAGTDCGSCHSSTTYAAGGFGATTMTQATHAFVSTTCDTCHGTATVSFYMGTVALQLRPADHTAGTMLTGDCSGCHTTANWNSTAMPAGHMPNPASEACTVCHTKAPSDYTTATLASHPVLHTGISSGCITCHGAPNASPPVFYLNFTPKDAVLSPVHIPTGATPCEDCHSATTFTAFSGTSMSSSKHSLMFSYIGSTCDACHESTTPALSFYGVSNLTTRPNGHHVGKDCSGCHNPNDWGGGAANRKASTKIAATTATRSTIGTVVSAPTAQSSATAASRVGAPRATGAASVGTMGAASIGAPHAALSAKPSHAGVTANCASCHNGVLAPDKGIAHIASNNACENCHMSLAWLPARFEHRGVTTSCTSCHNGALAPGKPTGHVPTAENCSTCHGTLTWSKASFSHLGINATCQSCHNGISATGKQIQHLITAQDCGSCHNTLSWTVATPPPPQLRPLMPLIKSPRGATSGPAK